MSENSAQPGYYPDPAGDISKLRYWNGHEWEDKYCDAPPQKDGTSASTNVENAAAANTNTVSSSTVETPATNIEAQTLNITAQGTQTLYPVTETDKNLRLAAFVLSVIACVGTGILIIPLAWTIPMTVRTYKIYKGEKPNTVAFGVCELLFVGLIAGVLLLCTHKDK